MAAEFSRRELRAFVADPRDLCVRDRDVFFGSEKVDACWNKVNSVHWERLMASDSGLASRWIEALRRRCLLHVNPFGARYIAESKLAMGFLQEERFGHLFTSEERDLVRTLLPWSRKMAADVTVEIDGVRILLERAMRERQQSFVIKQAYDIRGDGVTIGAATPPGEWSRMVDEGMARGYLAQRYVPPTWYPVVNCNASPMVVPMAVSLDAFVLGGTVAGFGSKASLKPKVNVFQGGQKVAVRVVDPVERDR